MGDPRRPCHRVPSLSQPTPISPKDLAAMYRRMADALDPPTNDK
jgi:hypothetical protein